MEGWGDTYNIWDLGKLVVFCAPPFLPYRGNNNDVAAAVKWVCGRITLYTYMFYSFIKVMYEVYHGVRFAAYLDIQAVVVLSWRCFLSATNSTAIVLYRYAPRGWSGHQTPSKRTTRVQIPASSWLFFLLSPRRGKRETASKNYMTNRSVAGGPNPTREQSK